MAIRDPTSRRPHARDGPLQARNQPIRGSKLAGSTLTFRPCAFGHSGRAGAAARPDRPGRHHMERLSDIIRVDARWTDRPEPVDNPPLGVDNQGPERGRSAPERGITQTPYVAIG
jgi:hypothetical protein